MKHPLLLLWIVSISCFSFSQPIQSKRIEIPYADNFINKDLINMGAFGFLIKSEKRLLDTENRIWRFDLYNKELVMVECFEFFLDTSFWLDKYHSREGTCHAFFRNKEGAYIIQSINTQRNEVRKVTGSIPKKLWVNEITVLHDLIYLKGYVKKEPFLTAIDWKTGSTHNIPLGFDYIGAKDITFKHFQILAEREEVLLYLHVHIGKKDRDLYILFLDDRGEIKRTLYPSYGLDEVLVSVSAAPLGEDDYVFSGTYSSFNQWKSEGIFFGTWREDTWSNIRFHTYLDLPRFLDHLSEKKRAKIRIKRSRNADRGKAYTPTYLVAAHDLYLLDAGYLFIGEAYYETTTIDDTCPENSTIEFDGYQYTHAFIAKFDEYGNLEWDDAFTMWPDTKPFNEIQFISISLHDPEVAHLMFLDGHILSTKTIPMDRVTDSKEEEDHLKRELEGDTFKRSSPKLMTWYRNHFISFGYQKIVNKKPGIEKKKREVFFVNKLSYGAAPHP